MMTYLIRFANWYESRNRPLIDILIAIPIALSYFLIAVPYLYLRHLYRTRNNRRPS